MNDQRIIQLLREGERVRGFQKLYRNYPAIKKLILSKGGTKTDAEDVFQEALIIFYKKARTENFELTASIGTYLYSVSRFIWKDELKRRNKNREVEIESDLTPFHEELIGLVERESKIKQAELILKQIGDRCLQILKLFYYDKLSMRVIAGKLGFKSENVAKNQKYKCIEKAKQKFANLELDNVYL